MKIIGITGKSGAGKTTLSNILAGYGNIKSIHIDDIMDNVKVEKFSKIMDKDDDENPVVVKTGLREAVYKNKIAFKMYIKFRSAIIKKELERQIEKYRMEGKEAVLIDSAYLII